MKKANGLDGWRNGVLPFKTLKMPSAVLMLGLLTIGGHACVFGQSTDSSFTKKQLQEAIGQLESNSTGDLYKSEVVMKRAIKDPAYRELATCSLALAYAKRGNLELVASFLSKSDALWPTPTPAQQNFLHRVQLSFDFIKGSETVTDGFSNLVRSTLDDKLAKESRLASAAMLGTMVGMLEPEAAHSPIDRKALTTAKDALLKSENSELANIFDSSYRKANTHAAALSDWMIAYQERPLDEAAKVATSSEEQLRIATQERVQSANSIREKTKEHRKTIYQLSKNKDAIQQEINAVLVEWNCHPEFHNPIMPDRRRISVRTTERVCVGSHRVKKKRTRCDDKGREEVYYEYEEVDDYETRRRPQHQIDRDIDAIFTPLMNRYLALKAAGQALIDKKENWEFQFRKVAAEIVMENRTIDTLEEKGQEELVILKRLRRDAKIAKEAMSALQSGQPERAFRPPNFEIFDYALETKVLRITQLAMANGATGRK